MARSKSRPQQWAEACGRAEQAAGDLADALQSLVDLQNEYEEWRDSLPDNLQDGPTAEKLTEVCDLELTAALDSANEIVGTVEGAAGLDLPQGFGRD